MTFYDLLKEVKAEDVVRNQECDRFAPLPGEEEITEEEKIQIYKHFIDKLLSLTPAENKDKKVLLGAKCRDTYINNETITDVALYYIDDVLTAMTEYYPEEKNNLSDEELEQEFKKRVNATTLPSGYAYEFNEWEDILGYEVDEDNVNAIGKEKFAGIVLYEMSFNGFDRESQDERREDLENRMKEFEEIKTLPKEEQEKRYVPIEKVFNDLAEKLGDDNLRWKEPTEEERKEMRRILNRDWMWNSVEKAKVFDAYKKRKNKELVEKYPFLKPRDAWTGEVDADYDYTHTELDNIPDGWRKVYGMLICEDLAKCLADDDYEGPFFFQEIKEKYGQLRLYSNYIPKGWDDYTWKYEHLTENTCIQCGKVGVPLTDDGWIIPLCKDCYEKSMERKKKWIEIVPEYEDVTDPNYKFETVITISTFSKEGKSERKIDCSDVLARVSERFKED